MVKSIQPLSQGMKSLVEFINANRVPKIIEISKDAVRFISLKDEKYVNQPLKTEFIPFT